MQTLPKSLQSVLWSANLDHLNMEGDKPYIIHQILSHGTLESLTWLFRSYSKDDICLVFMKYPYKDYSAARFHFISRRILGIVENLDANRYVINTPRNLG